MRLPHSSYSLYVAAQGKVASEPSRHINHPGSSSTTLSIPNLQTQELEAQAAGAEAALQAERSRSAAAAVAASQAQAHAFASPIPPSPPPAAGGAGRFAGARTVPSTPSAVEVKKMTKVAMQQWLTDAGEGATVYSLGLKNAKKAEYEAAVLDVLGSV